MSASLNSLIPQLRPYARQLVEIAGQAGLEPRVTSTRRTRTQQTRLYRAYLAGTQRYPVAPPGTSSHEYGFAFDMVISDLSLLAELGKIWKGWGGVWGGEFDDPIHFEFPGFPKAAAVRGAPRSNALARVSNTLFERYDQLPWYVQLLTPAPLAVARRQEIPENSLLNEIATWLVK